jgi:hypothetical protein
VPGSGIRDPGRGIRGTQFDPQSTGDPVNRQSAIDNPVNRQSAIGNPVNRQSANPQSNPDRRYNQKSAIVDPQSTID